MQDEWLFINLYFTCFNLPYVMQDEYITDKLLCLSCGSCIWLRIKDII